MDSHIAVMAAFHNSIDFNFNFAIKFSGCIY